ncbi:MAG: tRNA (adenosine(37)-N6)-threonylcarbamoyltransferase complex dimerization subunit type 1 TsaB [Clostridiales bacterium]
MKLLAIDTSTSCAGICIYEDNKVLAELNINNDKKTHSQKLIPYINNLLKEFGFKVSDFDIFAVTTGPGSFTGLRIGITTVKIFSYIYKKPLVGVTTLDTMVYNYHFSEKILCPIIDARNSQVYTSIYTNNGHLDRITDYMAIHIDELIKILNNFNREIIFLGDGIDKHRDFLDKTIKSKCFFSPANLKFQKSSSLATLAYEMYLRGEVSNSFKLEPFYLRKSQAERIRDERLKENKNGKN